MAHGDGKVGRSRHARLLLAILALVAGVSLFIGLVIVGVSLASHHSDALPGKSAGTSRQAVGEQGYCITGYPIASTKEPPIPVSGTAWGALAWAVVHRKVSQLVNPLTKVTGRPTDGWSLLKTLPDGRVVFITAVGWTKLERVTVAVEPVSRPKTGWAYLGTSVSTC